MVFLEKLQNFTSKLKEKDEKSEGFDEKMSEKTRNTTVGGNKQPPNATTRSSKDSIGQTRSKPSPATVVSNNSSARAPKGNFHSVVSTDKSNRPENKPWRSNMKSGSGSSEKSKIASEENNNLNPPSPGTMEENGPTPQNTASSPPPVPPKPVKPNVLPPAPQQQADPEVEKLDITPKTKPAEVPLPQEEEKAPQPPVTNGEIHTLGQEEEEQPSSGTPEEGEETQENNEVKLRPQKVPPPRVVNGTNGAIARGLEALAESEMEENLEEIKRLDTQLDHLHECLDKVEERITQHNTKIQDMLSSQKESRLQRKASFQQRVNESQAEDEDFHARVRAMLGKCAQSRRMSVPAFPDDIQDMITSSIAERGDRSDQASGRSQEQ